MNSRVNIPIRWSTSRKKPGKTKVLEEKAKDGIVNLSMQKDSGGNVVKTTALRKVQLGCG